MRYKSDSNHIQIGTLMRLKTDSNGIQMSFKRDTKVIQIGFKWEIKISKGFKFDSDWIQK